MAVEAVAFASPAAFHPYLAYPSRALPRGEPPHPLIASGNAGVCGHSSRSVCTPVAPRSHPMALACHP
eukprot:402078-Prymnesium_polylepis.1